jgi:hypothetical protein
MPPVVFEPAIPPSERLQTHTLDLRPGSAANKITWLESMAFYVWGELKVSMYVSVVYNVAELRQAVEDGCDWILDISGTSTRDSGC